MKRILFVAAFFVAVSCGSASKDVPTPEVPGTEEEVDTPFFAKGADISWASEMEAGGRTFKKKNGTVASLLDVLRECGINAIRLRVWVDPYGGWSGKDDVVAMAQKVSAAGLPLMVDFHYSDFFADPSRQQIPAAWQADAASMDGMCGHVSAHTREVLQALSRAGVKVDWVQIGNETRNGMLFGLGDAVWNNDQINLTNFVKLYNAGYDAAKAVYPQAFVMPHLNNAFFSAPYGNPMWLADFKAKGGKMDMIAFSHYPQMDSDMWLNGTHLFLTPEQVNSYAVAYIKTVIEKYGVPVMISEIGVKSTGKSYLQSFMTEIRKVNGVAGVFYWEPEVDGSWKPAVYSNAEAIFEYTGIRKTWIPYDMGAFTSGGQATSVMDVFND